MEIINALEAKKNSRIEVVDGLRGFAVIAILLFHNVEHYVFSVYPDKALQPAWLEMLNNLSYSVVYTLFSGKSYAIFAFLFGFTFYLQYTNHKRKNQDIAWRFLWRMILLVGFATMNAAFFPGGDVLLSYSILGLLLILVRKWSDKAILIFAVFLFLQPVEWFHCFASHIIPAYELPDFGIEEIYRKINASVKEGNWGKFLLVNITLGQKASLLWAMSVGRITQTAGLFMMGLLAGRKQIFVATESSVRFWTSLLIFSAIAFAPLYQLKIELARPDLMGQTVGQIIDQWQRLAFSIILISSFVMLYQREGFRKLTAPIRLYGRMSLTNYILQSVLSALIYFPIGLYLAPKCGYALSLCIGLFIAALQIMFSKWWLKTHKQGPLEAIWHKLTWIKLKK